jgi:stearoyl-CoA desaturase (delta-9 desaturase)
MKKEFHFLQSPSFILIHIACLLVIYVGVSWTALITCIALYIFRMAGITAGYHRYFSHRTYKTSRTFQFILAWIGASAAQQGPLWWAAHHRYHHQYSDSENDAHSPKVQGFWWSHIGWLFSPEYRETKYKLVPDLVRYRELLFINKYYLLPPASLAASLWVLGILLEHNVGELGTSGFQMFVWGFNISTILLYHGTFTINSLSHMFGRRRFQTKDNSRNNLLIALITLGEGWHNNHHCYPSSERQGFYKWEIDVSHYILRVLCQLGIVWDLRTPPDSVYRVAARGGDMSAPNTIKTVPAK